MSREELKLEESEVLEVKEKEGGVRRFEEKTRTRKEIAIPIHTPQPIHRLPLKLASIEVPRARHPLIVLKPLMLPKPKMRAVEIDKTAPLHLKVKAYPIEVEEINIQVLDSIPINISKPIHLRVRVEGPLDASIRPLTEASIVKSWGKVKPSLKVPLPHLKPSPLKKAMVLNSTYIKSRIALTSRLGGAEGISPLRGPEEEGAMEGVAEAEPSPHSPEVFGLPEGLLDEGSEFIKGGALSSVRPEGPICIVADKTLGFDEVVELLCSILYRIKSKGLPRVWTCGSATETLLAYRSRQDVTILEEIRGILKELERAIRERRPYQSILGEAQRLSKTFKDLKLEQAFRFIVLPVEAEYLERIKEILTDPQLNFRHYIPTLHIYKLKKLGDEQLTALLRAMFGFLEPRPYTINIGQQCMELESEFYRRLEEIMNEVKGRLPSQRQPVAGDELGQEESWLHYALKFLAIKHLMDNCGKPESSIKTEEMIGGVRADVSCEETIAIEIETFYGTILPFERKLVPKIKEYSGFQGQLWFVIPNIQALLYVDDLLKLRRDCRDAGMKLEIYTLDLTGDGGELLYGKRMKPGLIKLVDVLKWLRRNGLGRHQKFLQVGR